MRGFDLPSFLTGLLVGAFIVMLFAFLAKPAAADSAAEAALFRRCAEMARERGDGRHEELFRKAAREIGGTALVPDDARVTRIQCLGMRPVAQLYVPMWKPEQ